MAPPRLPLSQDRWFGKAPGQKDKGKSYREIVHEAVDLCASNGCHIILDLHEVDMGELGKNLGYHWMPDKNSLEFWKELAPVYKNHPAVIYELYNEPHDISWDIWRQGGKISEKFHDGSLHEYDAVGMQSLLNAVRDSGAQNVVIIDGLGFSSDLSWFKKGNHLDDRGSGGMLYAYHWYGNKDENTAKRIEVMTKTAREIPLIVDEFGAGLRPGDPHVNAKQRELDEAWVRQVVQGLEDGQFDWVAWSFHPGAAPCLISDWKGKPTAWFGQWVRKALLGESLR